MRERKRIDAGAALCALAFLACAALVARYLIAGYGAYLDSDMASELALAQQLVKEGTLISRLWRYSTEARVLSTELVFAPLMALFPNDWRLVRTLGCLILMAMLSASCYFAARSMGARRRYALLLSGLTLCPCSTVYAQMIVIGAYYVPHAILTNLYAGLCARCAGRLCRGERAGALAAALLLLAAAMGAQSVRYLLCAILPACAACLWLYVFPCGEREELPRTIADRRVAALAFGALACGAAGYLAGARLQSALLVGGSFEGSRLTNITGADLLGMAEDALVWLLRIVGYEEGRLALSLRGVFSAATVLIPALATALTVRAAKRAKREERHAARLGLLTLVLAFALTLFTFVFVSGLFLNRYWVPVMTLGAPVLACALTLERNPALRRGCALGLTVVTLGLCGAITSDSMAVPERGEDDAYNARALLDSGMTFGYATFWNANVTTELTDGRVEVVAISIGEDAAGRGVPVLSSWLEAEDNLVCSRPQERVFLLLTREEAESLDAFLSLCGAVGEPLRKGQTLYAVESQSRFFEAMEALGAGK